MLEIYGRKYCGKHLHIDLTVKNSKELKDADLIQKILEKAAKKAKATVLFSHFHKFDDGEGITGVIVLSESHISIHTWPENGFAAIDVFMCGVADVEIAKEFILESFSTLYSSSSVHFRGMQVLNRVPTV